MKGSTRLHATLLNILKVLVLAASIETTAFAQVTVTDIKVIEDKYSFKRLSGTFNYSGELGDALFFGATALTNDPVSGMAYGPSRVSQGVFVVEFTVTRPMLIDKDGTPI